MGKSLSVSMLAALALALMTDAALPAPRVGLYAAALDRHAEAQPVAYRRCWRQDGRRHCRWVNTDWRRHPRYGYRGVYGVGRPEDYPTGSTAWWRAMDWDNRGGHGRR